MSLWLVNLTRRISLLYQQTLNHMTALEKPLEHVIDKLEEEAAENR